MKKRFLDGAGYLKVDDRCSGGTLIEQNLKGCCHCHATIPVKSGKNHLSIRAHCHPCDGPLCTECGLDTQVHGHGNLAYPRTLPHDQWLSRALAAAYFREQNAKVLGI